MPENETLTEDPRSASRWRPVRDKIERDESVASIFPDVEKNFYAMLRRVWERWKEHGVSANEMFEAARNDRSLLRELVNRVRNDDFSRLLTEITVGRAGMDLPSIVKEFLDAVWEKVRAQLRLDCQEGAVPSDFLEQVNGMLDRICRGLLKNPNRVPPRPPSKKNDPDIDDLLNESLPLA